jgi:hypothetical protein
VVAQRVLEDALDALAGALGDDPQDGVAHVAQVVSLQRDVDGASANTGRALVQQHLGVRERVPLALGAAAQQELASAVRHAQHDGGNVVGSSCMVSAIASIAVTEPPGELIQNSMSRSAFSAASSNIWPQIRLATSLSTSWPRKTMRFLSSRS